MLHLRCFKMLRRKFGIKILINFFAPEVLNSNMGLGVDWEKADIYSLAKTILYIITGSVIEDA